MAAVNTQEEAVRLTPTERRLLTCLVRNAGRIVSHKELLKAIEHPVSRRGRHLLGQYIFRLRRKIEIDPALPRVIITHYGLGYSFAGKEGARWFPESEPS